MDIVDEDIDEELQDDGEEAEQLGQRGILSFEDGSSLVPPEVPELVRANSNASEDVSVLSIPLNELKVKFDIIGTKIISSLRRKYAVYLIIVLEAPKLDVDGAIVERRYSDFAKLHASLKKECPEATRRLPFPKKEAFGSLRPIVLEERSRKFEKYLRFVYHQQGVKDCQCFREFFYLTELREATSYLISEDLENSYEHFKLGLALQQKLGDDVKEIIPTLCGLVVVCLRTRRAIEGESLATRALELVGFEPDCKYLLPLILTTIELRKGLKMDTSWLSKKLAELEHQLSVEAQLAPTLRELAVKRF